MYVSIYIYLHIYTHIYVGVRRSLLEGRRKDLLKERAAHVAVEGVGEVLDQDGGALLHVRVLLRVIHRPLFIGE